MPESELFPVTFSDKFYSSNVLLRFLACTGLLQLGISTHEITVTFFLIVVAMVMIRGLDGRWQKLAHMLRLLRWFVLPILLLHLFFSHGQLIFPDSRLPVTWQGLQQGFWLSIHLICIFMAAMLMFRALDKTEWNRLLISLPFIGKHIAVYLYMVTPMRQQIIHSLIYLKQQWMLRRDWSRFPLLVLASFRLALSSSDDQVAQLWLRWPEVFNPATAPVSYETAGGERLAINIFCLVIALMAYVMVIV